MPLTDRGFSSLLTAAYRPIKKPTNPNQSIMGRKKKELPVLENVLIEAVAAEGKALARVDGAVVFVPLAAPGDIVDIKIDKKRRQYSEGHIVRFEKESEIRIKPRCAHFGECGGCRWQHLPYEYQLQTKQQQVEDALRRIGKVELPEIRPIMGSENQWAYRNKMEYTFSNKKWISWELMHSGEDVGERNGAGFHIPGAFDKVLDIDCCHLQNDLGNRIRKHLKEYGLRNNLAFYDLRAQQGMLRTLMIRILTTGEVMAVVVFGEDRPEEIKACLDDLRAAFPEITSLMWVVNEKLNDTIADLDIKLHSGREWIEEDMEGLRFRIGPKSFYQTNSHQAYRLYSVVRELADLKGSELVYDLYTGTGTIANFLARSARKVIGIEYVEPAVVDARINSQANGIANTEFFAGDMKDVLTDGFIAEHGRPEVMIVDPPRAGMHQDVVDVILNAEPQRIVYVSCNPATQARDLSLLDAKYRVTAVQPVDMFPHTHHVENVVALELRQTPQSAEL